MISVSRDSNILAAIIPLTSGVMLQVFRVTPNGLVELAVGGQLPRIQANVSVSPTGEYIVTHLATAGTPGFSVWRYNSTTDSYSRVYQSGNYSAFIGGESVWLNNTVFARYTNSASKTSVAVFGMNGNSASQIYSVTELDYIGADIFATPDGRNFIVGTQTGNNNNARVYAFESGVVSNPQNLIAGGFQTGDIDSTGTKVLGSRSTSAPALDAYSLPFTGPFAGLARIAENLSTTADTVRFIYDDIVLRNSPTGVTFHTYDAGVLSAPIAAPEGLESLSEITSKIKWSRFSNTDIFAGYSGGTVYVFMYLTASFFAAAPIGDAFFDSLPETQTDLIAAAPIGDAFVLVVPREQLNLLAAAPIGDAWAVTDEPRVIKATAEAPMGDATFRSIGQHFINIAEAPMGDAWASIPNENMTLFDVAPMGGAWFFTTFDTLDFVALAPMGNGLITIGEAWNELVAEAPMGDATFDVPNVYVNALDATAPMGDATFDVPNVYVNALDATAPMGTAWVSAAYVKIEAFTAEAPMGDAFAEIKQGDFEFFAVAPMAYAFADLLVEDFGNLIAFAPMGEATADVEVPITVNVTGAAPMGDASVALDENNLICRRRSMMIIQVF